MMKRRWLWLGAIAVGVMILLTLLAAPNTSQSNNGSTYGRAPDGYGAWYAFMQQQGTPVKRWQKPFEQLPGVSDVKAAETPVKNPITFLRVNSHPGGNFLYSEERDWVEKGNTLVLLGVRSPVTKASFSTMQTSSVGAVKIDTRRRREFKTNEKSVLGDRFGSVVWQETVGAGKVIFATTPYLAANAYQNEPGNYQFLAQLVTQKENTIWVDEYIHGYKDQDVATKEDAQDFISYLAKTPLLAGLLQAGVLITVLIIAQNRRFGRPLTLSAPVIDNTEAYIQALAGVLQKAESGEFVVEVVGKEEQLQLQKALGLGTILVEHPLLVKAWTEQTKRPASELEQVLRIQAKKRRLSDQELLTWLGQWQSIRSHLPSSGVSIK